jgi:hypothetical protein
LKLSQARVPAIHGASRTWLVRTDSPTPGWEPGGSSPFKVSHRFGPLIGPLDVTGYVSDSNRILTGLSQYPVFKVQAQRGDTLLVPFPAVNGFLQPISATCRSAGDERRPHLFGRGRRLGAGAPAWLVPAPLSDRPRNTPSYQPALHLRTYGRSSLGNVPPAWGAAQGQNACSYAKNGRKGTIRALRHTPGGPQPSEMRAKRRFPTCTTRPSTASAGRS